MDLRLIFESSGNLRRIHLPQEYQLLSKYIATNVIHLESYTLNSMQYGIQEQLVKMLDAHQWDELEIAQAIPLLASISNGGGREHQRICWCAAAWLFDKGYQSLSEQRFNGCRVDLLTTCHTWAIECGDTSPVPIPRHLLRGIQQVGVIPFQANNCTHLEIFVFTKDNAWDSQMIRNDLIVDLSR